MVEAIIVVCWVELGKSLCDTKLVEKYNTSTICWKHYNDEKQTLKQKYKKEKKSPIISYGGCF
tara:strand:- start:327 stop:515 length:189 start_codon:yes stop_codon:yes gene_type:complete